MNAYSENAKRAHSPPLRAGLASEYEKEIFLAFRRFPAACCGELQYIDAWRQRISVKNRENEIEKMKFISFLKALKKGIE